MRIGALVALLCVAACRNRPLARTAQQGDSVDLAQLVPRDSTDGTLLVPKVVTEPSVVLFWLRAADTLGADDRADTFDDLKYYTEQIAPALEAGGIKLLATNAETVYVALPNRTRRAILLSGLDYPYGYLLIDPGGPERILTGVYADDDLLEELRGRVRGRRSPGRASGLLRPAGRYRQRPAAHRDLRPCRPCRTRPTCFSPAAMCCCTTANGGWSGRT